MCAMRRSAKVGGKSCALMMIFCGLFIFVVDFAWGRRYFEGPGSTRGVHSESGAMRRLGRHGRVHLLVEALLLAGLFIWLCAMFWGQLACFCLSSLVARWWGQRTFTIGKGESVW